MTMVQQREGREEQGQPPYGFVNIMSDALSVQRIMCKRRYVRSGRIPDVRGSSSLEESYRQSHIGTRRALGPDRVQDSGDVQTRMAHVKRWFRVRT